MWSRQIIWKGDHEYRSIGSVYVDGYMYGKATDEMDERQLELKAYVCHQEYDRKFRKGYICHEAGFAQDATLLKSDLGWWDRDAM